MMIHDSISITWDIMIPHYTLTLNVSDTDINTANVTGLNHYDVNLANLDPCLLYNASLAILKLDGTYVDTRTVSTYPPPGE